MKTIKLLEYLEKNLDIEKFLQSNPEFTENDIKQIFKNLKKLIQAPYELYIDGASRGNPGKAGCGFVILKDGKEIVRGGKFIGIKTNNEAEYFALLLGLKKAIEIGIKKLKIFSDSNLLVNQIKGTYKVKDNKLKKLNFEILKLLENLDYEIEHIPREKNKIADNIANQKIDDAI